MDPLSEHEDLELWNALEVAQIKDIIASHPEGLSKWISNSERKVQFYKLNKFLFLVPDDQKIATFVTI